jgi:hypothetical protein
VVSLIHPRLVDPGDRSAYLSEVILFVRAARVILTLILAALVVSLVIGLARPETGIIEKAVLVTLIAGCVFLAAQLSAWSTKAQARFRRI